MRTFTINRKGTFVVKDQIYTQCKSKGHTTYNYFIKATCGDILDKQDFVIDHNEIDEAVQRCIAFKGAMSCERYASIICTWVNTRMKDHGCSVREIYVKIEPEAEQVLGYIEHTLTT